MADATVLVTPTPSAADALRQAALQSRLRNKRKRSDPSEPTTPNTFPPPTQDSVMLLNYDDEPAEPIVAAVAVVAPAEPASDSARSAAAANDEDTLEREDGEISEADIDPSSLPTLPASNAPPPTAAEIERSLLLTPNHPPRPYQSAAQPAHENGLRPKLRISPGELHEFKLHLLDILGFGVPPEYLIEYGVSPETLAYALHELNFRQPTNLVFAGNDDNSHFYPSGLNQHIVLPPPPSTNGKASPSMLEIESQKKRELQARKAALAAKRAASVGTPSTPTTTGPIAASPTISEAVVDVDDFLRSIAAPVAAPPPAALLRTQSPDAMQVDSAPSIVPPHPEQRPRSTSAGLSINSDAVSTLPRGIKRARPVAADFDDNDLPSRPASAMRPPPPMRNPMRKLSSFSNLNMQLREPLVIHVSDSEDDHDEHWATAPPSRPMSALEEREAQIAAMKERIAAAELKKKAVKRVSTPVPAEPKREAQTPTIPSPVRHSSGSATSVPPADFHGAPDVTVALVPNDPAHVQDLSVHNSMEVDNDPADQAARIEHSSAARGGLAADSVTNNPPDVSAQNAEGHVHGALDEYKSFFSAYPGMRHLVQQDSSGGGSVFPQEDARSTFDANSKICQYEVPGGGECKDANCTDVHLSRL